MEDKKKLLYKCAKELFSENGFKNTNVSAITRKAGMAVGSFYNYYSSKEDLFMDIYLEENAKLKREIMRSLDLSLEPLMVIGNLVALNFKGMQENPILREWYNKSVFDKIEQTYREKNGVDAVDFLYDSFLEIIEMWQSRGKMRKDIDSKTIMMIFVAIINIDTHKEEIGIEYFPELLEKITELIMQSLTKDQGKDQE
ncbi:MAG: hypothetical protein PWQ77_2158 [Kosmotogales bacterium]|nr:hypothetical protein [Kosmotogales bacterium]